MKGRRGKDSGKESKRKAGKKRKGKREEGRIRTCKSNMKIQELWDNIFKLETSQDWLPIITPNTV